MTGSASTILGSNAGAAGVQLLHLNLELKEAWEMAIGNAVQRESSVYVFDEMNRQACTIPAGSGPEDGLKGYTSSRVSVRRGSFICSYDESGS